MRSNTTFNNKKIQGLSLVEVLVTIVITSIGLMGLVSLQMQSVLATSDTGNRSHAIWVFNDIINRIHANEVASASYIGAGPVTCNAPAKVCSSYHDGTNVVNAVNCSGAELAAWDRYEVACQLKPAPFFGDSTRYLPNAQLTIACPSGACNNGDPLQITLQWRARMDDESITGAARTANSGLLTITDVITP